MKGASLTTPKERYPEGWDTERLPRDPTGTMVDRSWSLLGGEMRNPRTRGAWRVMVAQAIDLYQRPEVYFGPTHHSPGEGNVANVGMAIRDAVRLAPYTLDALLDFDHPWVATLRSAGISARLGYHVYLGKRGTEPKTRYEPRYEARYLAFDQLTGRTVWGCKVRNPEVFAAGEFYQLPRIGPTSRGPAPSPSGPVRGG